MNIFGVGGTELVIIFLIMLVVAGPKRMVRWAYFIGQYVGKFRKMWSEVVDVVQKEMDAAGMDVQIPKELPTKQNISKYVNEFAKPYTKELEQAAKELENPIKATLEEADKSVKESLKEADKTAQDAAATVAEANEEIKADKPAQSAKNYTPVIKWGQPKEQKSVVETPPKPEPASSENGGFGAWSNPQKPGAGQVEQEA